MNRENRYGRSRQNRSYESLHIDKYNLHCFDKGKIQYKSISISQDGSEVICVDLLCQVLAFDINTGELLRVISNRYVNKERTFTFTFLLETPYRLIFCYENKIECIFSIEEEKNWVVVIDSSIYYIKNDVTISKDKSLIAYCNQFRVNIYDTLNGNLIKELNYQDKCYSINSANIDSDNKVVVYGTGDGNITIYDITTGKSRYENVSDEPIKCCRFSRYGKEVIVLDSSDTIQIYSMKNFNLSVRIETCYSGTDIFGSIEIINDNQVISTFDGGFCIWNIYTGKLIERMIDECTTIGETIRVSQDGNNIVLGYLNDKVIIWKSRRIYWTINVHKEFEPEIKRIIKFLLLQKFSKKRKNISSIISLPKEILLHSLSFLFTSKHDTPLLLNSE